MKFGFTIYTSVKFGPWKIPHRGQTYILNHYANIKNIKVSYQFSSDFLFDLFENLKSIVLKLNKEKIVFIFSSVNQLSFFLKDKKKFINFLKNYEVHFALELKNGKGKKFLENSFNELETFSKIKVLNMKKIKSYSDLYKEFKNKI